MKKRILIALVVVLALAATASLVWANSGPVSYWPFDEGGGTTALDAVNGNDGTHGATYVAGKFGSALQFDGTNHVQVPDDVSLEPVNVTVAAWVQAPSTPGSSRYIVSKGASGCTAASYAFYTAGGGLSFYVFNGSTYKLSPNAGSSLWDGEWHHVAGTYDGSFVRLYVDGTQIGTGTATSISIGYGLPTTDDFFVGIYGGTCSLPFVGLIDEVGVWDRALSGAEIAALARPALEVDIDIKPGSFPNCINPDSKGVIPVAILSTDTFDAASVDPFSVTLEGAGVRVKGKSGNAGSLEDVDGDGDLDLVVQIMDDTALAGKSNAIVMGETFDGQLIGGIDSICIVPPQ